MIRRTDYGNAEALRQRLADARSLLKVETSAALPIGVGLIAWKLEEQDISRAYDMIDVALTNRVKAIWFSFGRRIGTWIQHVRQWDELHDQNTTVFVLVSSLHEAEMASKDWGADVLVAQGDFISNGYNQSSNVIYLVTQGSKRVDMVQATPHQFLTLSHLS